MFRPFICNYLHSFCMNWRNNKNVSKLILNLFLILCLNENCVFVHFCLFSYNLLSALNFVEKVPRSLLCYSLFFCWIQRFTSFFENSQLLPHTIFQSYIFLISWRHVYLLMEKRFLKFNNLSYINII